MFGGGSHLGVGCTWSMVVIGVGGDCRLNTGCVKVCLNTGLCSLI